MTKKQEIIDKMFSAACGYGMAEGNGFQSKFAEDGSYMKDKTGGTKEGGKEAFKKCIDAIPKEYLDDFLYTLYRIADKSGCEGFDF